MNILFVYTSLPKGGIETFFVRIVKRLSNEGHLIHFLFFSGNFDDDLLKELKKYAKVYSFNDYLVAPHFFKNKSPLLKILLPLKKKKLNFDLLNNIDHIHAPDFNSILYVNRILNKNHKKSISTGVYHINEFNFDIFHRWYFAKEIKKFLNILPPENILFFNEISKEYYNQKFSNKFENSIVTPIGIDITKYTSNFSAKQNNRVVSIGRLTKWKKYNHNMIEVIHSLKQKNVLIRYDCYGDGEELELLKEKVNYFNLNDLITFHPSIPYNQFQEVINNSLMFIGAGTSLIEASACGLPSLIGIENEKKPVTYGFLHDTKGYSYQEQQLKLEKKNIENYILYLKELTNDSFNIECNKAITRAKDFTIDITQKDFNQLINKSKKSEFQLRYIHLFFMVVNMFLNKLFCPKTNYSKRL
jgi:1,2-diacylglycerol 3-alpha-glucosyltransferase